MFRSVVLVGLYDEACQRILQAGSGFFVDKKRGFIVTAGHTLLDKDTWREPRGGKIVIGVIPHNSENVCCFRYFARIISKDPSINDKGCAFSVFDVFHISVSFHILFSHYIIIIQLTVCSVDACVLQITTRLENDVFDSGKAIGEQPEVLLMNSPQAMKKEDLSCLSLTEKVELDETIRVLGFNQGGEGLVEPGSEVHRFADFARGYVGTSNISCHHIVDILLVWY
jgi:hypothetical protein